MSKHKQTDGSNTGEEQPDSQSGLIGQSITRVDAVEKVTGAVEYTMDMYPDDILHAKLLTSDHAHARITAIDTAEAEQSTGVVAVATAEDTPDTRLGEFILDQPIFADEKVRYAGEPIAIVAAESEQEATKAVERIDVTYEPLETAVDLQSAYDLEPPAVVHENVKEYETREDAFHIDGPASERPNLLTTVEEGSGDVDEQFERADFVFEDEYHIEALQHCTMEPHVAVAQTDGTGATVWTSHQIPHVIKHELERLFPTLGEDSVDVKTPYCGGAFGSKETPIVEPQLLSVAQQTDRPVRLALSRHEQYTTSPSRPEFHIRLKDGVTEDGDLLAREATINLNVGAYDVEVYNITHALTSSTIGSYDVPAVHRRCNAIYTNKTPYGAYRGFGHPEVNFATERHMTRVAKKLGMDPLEYREKNLLETGDENNMGDVLHPAEHQKVLREPLERLESVDIEKQYPSYDSDEWKIGIGHAYGNKSVPGGETEVQLDLDPSGEITARVGAPDVGQGSNTAVKQMVADEFGTAAENVTVIAGDTDETKPDMQGPSGSRFTPFTGNALRTAAGELTDELLSLASDLLDIEHGHDSIELVDGILTDTETGKSVSVSDIADSAFAGESGYFEDGQFTATASYDWPGESLYWVPVAQAVILACNTLTGKVDVLRIVTASDVGVAINPKNIEQQLEGGTGQGIAGALYEQIEYDDGKVVNGNFKQYRVPKSTELPYESETVIFESTDPEGPFGAKSVGEVAVFPTGAAVAAAIEDAVGLAFNVQPITPERLLDKMVTE